MHLGRIKGIEIGANWSVLVIAWLLTWTLAESVLPAAVPGRPTAAYWVTGAGTAVLFLASLVTHELSHAIVARRHGVEVKQITLWLFGGVAKLESNALDPRAELRIGGVGPLVSIALGAVLLAVAVLVGLVEQLELLAAALAWVALMNVVLGVFNLLPAFPLDGGRVLRAILWRRSGDHIRSTERAGRVSVVFGYLLTGLGFYLLLGGLLLNGVWFLFLGWFLLNAARDEVAAVRQDVLLTGVRVEQVMSAPPVVVRADLPVDRLIDEYVLRHHHSAYPIVTPGGEPLGLVTLDRVRSVPVPDRSAVAVGRIAIGMSELVIANPRDEVRTLVARLGASAARRALVVDRGQLVGIITPTDIMRALDLRALLWTGGAPAGQPAPPAGTTGQPGSDLSTPPLSPVEEDNHESKRSNA